MQLEHRNKALMVIGEEHEHLLRLLAGLDEVIAHDPVDRQRIIEILYDVFDEVSLHFEHEESLMLEMGSAGFIDHQSSHPLTLDSLKSVIAEYGANKISIEKVRVFIKDYLEKHMEMYDDSLIVSLSR